MANVLMLYRLAPHTTANYMAKALRANGHDVYTAGRSAMAPGCTVPYRVWGPHNFRLGDHDMLNLNDLGDWRPDLILWAESGDGPMGLEGVIDADIPLAGWFMDSHNPAKLPWHKRMAAMMDYRFCAQRPYCEELSAEWLPFGCDPEVHTPRVYSEEYDLAFVGSAYGQGMYSKRYEAMAKLEARYRCNFKSGVYFEDMANVYGSAKIGWHMSVTGQDIDMRVFEIMCSGRPLVTDDAEDAGLDELFGLYREGYYTYANEKEMNGLIESFLRDPALRDMEGAAGRKRVLAHHTYQHRAHQLMQTVGLE